MRTRWISWMTLALLLAVPLDAGAFDLFRYEEATIADIHVPIAGWGEERARAVEISGDTDPILPTPFRIGGTSAAALAAVGLAVSDLWALRSARVRRFVR